LLQKIQEAEVERLKEQLKAKAQEAVDSTKAGVTIANTFFFSLKKNGWIFSFLNFDGWLKFDLLQKFGTFF